jgi:hypothetical protein
VFQQQLDDFFSASVPGSVEGGLVSVVFIVDIRPGFYEDSDDIDVAGIGGEVERRVALVVSRAMLCASLEQSGYRLGMAFCRSDVQGAPGDPIGLGRIHASFNQQLHYFGMALFGGGVQGRSAHIASFFDKVGSSIEHGFQCSRIAGADRTVNVCSADINYERNRSNENEEDGGDYD